MDVIYQKQRWKLLVPKDLKFPSGCIRNILIEKDGEREITHIKKIKKISTGDILSWA